MVSFDTMLAELRARLGNRTDLDSRMGRWINYAFFEILLNPRFDFYELDKSVDFDTVGGKRAYELFADIGVTDLWFILDLRDNSNERKLRRTHWSYVDKFSIVTGQPVRYYRYNSAITVDPTPDNTYHLTLRYRLRPSDLTSGSNFQGLGTEWEEPIVTLAAVKAWEALKQPDYASSQRQLLEVMFQTRQDAPALEDLDSETGVEVALHPRL